MKDTTAPIGQPSLTSIADILGAANMVPTVEQKEAVTAPEQKRRGVAPGTRHTFSFSVAAFMAMKESLKKDLENPEKVAQATKRLKTIETLESIPQVVTTEVPRTREQIMELMQAEMDAAKAENRIPDLAMIGALATIKHNGSYTLPAAAANDFNEYTVKTATIREYYAKLAEQTILALPGITATIAEFEAGLEENDANEVEAEVETE